jgi:hypothetical protein
VLTQHYVYACNCPLRFLINQFITPIKQAGVIIKLVGKATGTSPAEKGGKVVEELMDGPEEKTKTVINTTTKGCARVRVPLVVTARREHADGVLLLCIFSTTTCCRAATSRLLVLIILLQQGHM